MKEYSHKKMENDAALRQQFELLQQQQAKKLARRKQAKTQEKPADKSAGDNSFGISDNLDLKLAEPPAPGTSYLSDELVNHLNEQIRELKDENGRLYKLLSERDFEIRQLKKKREEDKQTISGGGVASDQVATKIVELSKKVRELTSEVESEKTKSKQLFRKCRDQQKELDNASQGGSVPPSARSIFTSLEDGKTYTETDYKALQDKVRQAESKATDYRNQCQSLRNELKMAQKVITSECGDGVTVQSLMKEGSNWRGRAQQVIALQRKVTELKSQLDQPNRTRSSNDLEHEMMGTTAKKTVDNKQKEAIKRQEKERKEAQEKAQSELKALEEDHSLVKEKLSASKARNKVLSNEVKGLKQHVQRLLDKGHHDDELIDALMKQQAKLKSMIDDSSSKQKQASQQEKDKVRDLAAKVQHDTNVTEQLRAIVMEKEAMVKSLEEEIRTMRQSNLQKSQVEAANTLFERVASRTTSRHGEKSPAGSPSPPSRLSVRSISRQSAIMNGNTTDRPTSRWGSPGANPPSGNAVDTNLINELQVQVQEFKSLAQASDVERDKLLELVQVLQKRTDEANFKAQDATTDLTAQKKKNALLEKQLGKAKLEYSQQQPKSGTKKVRVKPYMDEDSMTNENGFDSSNLEEVETRLEIQIDENEALKAALESTLKSKEEDLKMYNEMLEQTKHVFLQGLRQHRQNSAH